MRTKGHHCERLLLFKLLEFQNGIYAFVSVVVKPFYQVCKSNGDEHDVVNDHINLIKIYSCQIQNYQQAEYRTLAKVFYPSEIYCFLKFHSFYRIECFQRSGFFVWGIHR